MTRPSETDPATQISYGFHTFPNRQQDLAGYTVMTIDAGNRGTERVVPPAGEEHAFDRQLWARHVQVSVSPTGRSVRVFVDGIEIKPTQPKEPTP